MGRSTQKLHFSILPLELILGAPKGQAHRHSMQPTHFVWSTVTAPVSSLLVIACLGHAFLHGASPQCIQASETLTPVISGNLPRVSVVTFRHFTVWFDPFHIWQATSQARQPTHFSLSK